MNNQMRKFAFQIETPPTNGLTSLGPLPPSPPPPPVNDGDVKAGVQSHILAGYYVFYANILFTFQAIKNLSAHLTYLCFGLFWKFFGDF